MRILLPDEHVSYLTRIGVELPATPKAVFSGQTTPCDVRNLGKPLLRKASATASFKLWLGRACLGLGLTILAVFLFVGLVNANEFRYGVPQNVPYGFAPSTLSSGTFYVIPQSKSHLTAGGVTSENEDKGGLNIQDEAQSSSQVKESSSPPSKTQKSRIPPYFLYVFTGYSLPVLILLISFGVLAQKRMRTPGIQAEPKSTPRPPLLPTPNGLHTTLCGIAEIIIPSEVLMKFMAITPTPIELLGGINDLRTCEERAVIPTIPWEGGFSTQTGNIRPDNQDYGVCFQHGEKTIAVIADGVGGGAYGKEAAFFAVAAASMSLMRSGDCRIAIKDASRVLKSTAYQYGIQNESLDFRTTLIVLVIEGEILNYAYIGDGGGYVFSSGEFKRFLVPQKVEGMPSNYLGASLGPEIDGEPISGQVELQSGDLVIAGTDGIFDVVTRHFYSELIRMCLEHDGQLQMVASEVVKILAEHQDEYGYVFQDNLTFALLGTGSAPELPHDFGKAA